jgi:hypothetical protein
MGGKRRGAIALACVSALFLAATAGVAAAPTKPLPPPRATQIGCEGTGGRAAPFSGSIRAANFQIADPRVLGSHFNPAANRFSAKLPAAVHGSRAVDIRVPTRLEDEFRFSYGGSGQVTELRLEPCAKFPATFFPGGILFLHLKPLSLLVSPVGSTGPAKVLRLGVVKPRKPRGPKK